jgi:flavocytochrome c
MSNEQKKDNTSELSRRRFLAGAGMAAVAGALAGGQIFPKELKAKELPKSWDLSTDVVVIGTGYAGLAAAITAHDAGAKVVVLEKNRMVGGNSAIASGALNCVDPKRQKAQDIKDSIDLHYQQTISGGDYRGDPINVRYLVEHGLEGLEWLEKLGVEFEPKVYAVVGALWPRSHDPIKGGRGGAIVRALKAQVDKRKIPVLFEHKLSGLNREKPDTGRVLGVEVEHKGKKLNIKAQKGVILATGGFSADVFMRSKFDPRLNKEVPTTNVPTATGESIIYAEDIGADVVGMDYIQGLMACNYFTKKYGSLANLGIDSAIFVNLEGKRFVAEDQRRDVMSEATLVQPKKVLLWVADDTCKKRYVQKQIDGYVEKGLIYKADTLDGLAKTLKEKLGVPPETFLATVKHYNELAQKGEDKEFSKKKTNLKPIVKAPFWASPTQVGVHHTMGGLRISGPTCQVLDRWGKAIDGLYAAGEVTGGIHGTNRLGGNATTDCVVFGRNAGRQAAKGKA